MSVNEQESINEYIMNQKNLNASNVNTTKLTEISQIMNCIDAKQNYHLFQNLDNPSSLMTTNLNENHPQILSQLESTPYNMVNLKNGGNYNNLSSLPHTDFKDEQHPYFSNISPVSRYQTKISAMGSMCPITGSNRSSQITPSNINNVYQQPFTKVFTPSSNIVSSNNKPYHQSVPQISSFIQNASQSNNSSISSSRLNVNKNNIDYIKNDENALQFSNHIKNNNSQFSNNLSSLNNNTNNNNKYQVGQDNSKKFFKSEQSPRLNLNENLSTTKLLAKIRNEDDINYQKEMIQAEQYLSKVFQNKFNNSREEPAPNFGAILAKRTSPPLKGKNSVSGNRINIGSSNSNNSHSQSGILQLTTIQSQSNLANGNPNNNSMFAVNSNQSVVQLLSNHNQNQSNIASKNHTHYGTHTYQSPLNQTNDSIKLKNALGGTLFQKDDKGIQESKAYLQAMKALQERIKELEKQLLLQSESEIRQHMESQYQNSIEEGAQIIENINNKNIIMEQQISDLLNDIAQYKEIIAQRENEFQLQREEWLQGNQERNAIIESHIQKQAQLSTQLQEEIERNHQLQIELNETQQKWQMLHEEHQLIQERKIEILQVELEEEKASHNELKSLCVKSTEEIETLLAQNKALDHKLQVKEKEFDEYKILFNQGNVDLLKDQIKEQKEFLEKIEEKTKQNYDAKQIQLETELTNARLIEKQLKNEIIEIRKGVIQRSKEQMSQSLINSPNKSLQNYNYYPNNVPNDVRYQTGQNLQMPNQLYQQNQQQQIQNQMQQQSQTAYRQESGQANSQSELEKYLSPGTPLMSSVNNNSNNINNNQIPQNLNTPYNPSIEQQLTLNTPNQQLIQNQQLLAQNFQNNIQNQQNMHLNSQLNNYNNTQQPINHNINHGRGNSHQQLNNNANQINDMEYLSLQEESDLLNFDYDELQQQSRVNSKNSPLLQNRQQNQIMSLDSPLRKRSAAYNNNYNNGVSSSLQITKQFQNQGSLQNSLNNYQYSFMNSQHQQQENSPQRGRQMIANPSPFFSPTYAPTNYEAQLSPDFKPASTTKNITHKMNFNQNNRQQQVNQVIDNFNQDPNYSNRQQQQQIQQQQQQQQQQQIVFDHQANNKQYLSQSQKRGEYQEVESQQSQQQFYSQQKQPSSYLQYCDSINNELEYKKQVLALTNKRSKSSNQSLHKSQQQQQVTRTHKSSVDNILLHENESNQEYPSNVIGNELIRDIFEAESEQKLLNQRYEVLLAESRNEENSKKKSEIRKELITISEKIKILNEKLYVLKKREKFIMNQQLQKNQQNEQQEVAQQITRQTRQIQSSSLHQQQQQQPSQQQQTINKYE